MDENDWTVICFKRKNRNQLLSNTDKFLLSDYPISPDNLILIKEYRQQLRNYMDLPEVINFNSSSNIPLPDFPEFPF